MVDWFWAVRLTAKRKCSCTCQAEGKSGGLRNQRGMTGYPFGVPYIGFFAVGLKIQASVHDVVGCLLFFIYYLSIFEEFY